MSTSRASEILFLPDNSFRSQAAGRADVIRSLAGRTRALYELAAGENPFPGEPAATPRNPSGDLGVNLSGPPWGSALLHPIAWVSGRSASANAQGERQVAVLAPGASTVIGPWPLYNRQYERIEAGRTAPYSRGYVRFFAHIDVAGSADLEITLASSVSDGRDSERIQTDTVAITSTSVTAYEVTPAYLDLAPGNNVIWIGLTNNDDAAGQTITVTSLAVHQIVKRSHT